MSTDVLAYGDPLVGPQLITYRRSVAKRGGCFRRRLFVSAFVRTITSTPCQISFHRCNVSPLLGEKPQNRPLSNLYTVYCRFALRAMLPVKTQRFWPPRRRVKSELHETWHGDRGPRAGSCTSKTCGGPMHSFAARRC